LFAVAVDFPADLRHEFSSGPTDDRYYHSLAVDSGNTSRLFLGAVWVQLSVHRDSI